MISGGQEVILKIYKMIFVDWIVDLKLNKQ